MNIHISFGCCRGDSIDACSWLWRAADCPAAAGEWCRHQQVSHSRSSAHTHCSCLRCCASCLQDAVLCCAVLCCAVLCCAVRCCAMLCCGVLCCAELCCVVLCCAVHPQRMALHGIAVYAMTVQWRGIHQGACSEHDNCLICHGVHCMGTPGSHELLSIQDSLVL